MCVVSILHRAPARFRPSLAAARARSGDQSLAVMCTRSGRGDSPSRDDLPSSGYDDGGHDADFENRPFPRSVLRRTKEG
jgi:hypothetical protein